MAFDAKTFVTQARAKGVPDSETYKYLQTKGVIDASGKVAGAKDSSSGGTDWLSKIGNFAKGLGLVPEQFGAQAGAAIGQAGLGIGQALVKTESAIAGAPGIRDIPGASTVKGVTGTIADTIGQESKALYGQDNPLVKNTANTVAGVAGKVVGTVAPYLATGGPISGATNAAASLAAKVPGASGAIYRTLLGMSAEGVQNYILGYALSGGDTKQALTQGVTAGVLKAGFAGTGEALKGAGMDTALMRKIYSSNKADTEGLLSGSKTKSLADEALDHGFTGSVQNQYAQAYKGLSDSEKALEAEFAKAGNPLLDLKNPERYVKVIQDRINLLNASGATEEAQGLQSSLANFTTPSGKVDGKITANAALGLRRFLDGLRQSKSFVTPTEELQAQQAGLKEMSDSLRSQINSIGKNSKIMKGYQFYLNAKDALVEYAQKKGNKQVFDFFDKMLFAESIFAHTPTGLGIAAGRHITGAAPASAAQFIRSLPQSTPAGTVLRSVTGAVLGGTQKPQ